MKRLAAAALDWLWDRFTYAVMNQGRSTGGNYVINGCSLNLEQLGQRDLSALIENQTKRAELLASELQLLTAEQRRRDDAQPQHLNSVA